MKPNLRLLLLIALLVMLSAKSSSALSGNWFFSIQPDSVQCVDIILPDDAGYFGTGAFEYRITCEPLEECLSWGATVTDEKVTASENNTGIIPVCFNTMGKPLGNCSLPMTLSLECNELGISKSWEGGVCVSRYRDFETAERKSGESVQDVLDNNFGLFDAGFSQPVVYILPSKTMQYPLFIDSYANITVDVDINSGSLSAQPLHSTLSLSKSEPHKSLTLTLTAPASEGRYDISAAINVKNCDDSSCAKTIHGTVVVSSDTNNIQGFSLSLFPENINIKELKPVIFTYTIHNYGERRNFDLSLSINPEGNVLTTFRDSEIDLDSGEEINKSFLVTPMNATTMYEITLTASSKTEAGSDVKRSTSILSVNEMLTDVARERDSIKDPNTRKSLQDDIDDWYHSYLKSEYGDNMKQYKSLKDALGSAAKSEMQTQNTTTTSQKPVQENQENPFILPLLIIIVAAIVVILVYKTLSSKNRELEEFDYF